MGAPLVEAPILVPIVRALFAGAAVAAFVLAVPRSRERPPATLALEYGLGHVAMLLISPLAEDIHFVYALPALLAAGAVAWRAAWWARPIEPTTVALGLAAAGLYGFFLLPMHVGLAHNVPFYGLCTLAALAATVAIRQRRRGEPAMVV